MLQERDRKLGLRERMITRRKIVESLTRSRLREVERALRGTVNEEAFEDLRSLKSIPFTPGKKIAVEVIDHRGNEMLEVFHLSNRKE